MTKHFGTIQVGVDDRQLLSLQQFFLFYVVFVHQEPFCIFVRDLSKEHGSNETIAWKVIGSINLSHESNLALDHYLVTDRAILAIFAHFTE